MSKHLDPVTHVVQQAIVDGLADVADGPLLIGRGDDLVRARRVLVGGEDANLTPSYLLLVDVHRLREKQQMGRKMKRPRRSIPLLIPHWALKRNKDIK